MDDNEEPIRVFIEESRENLEKLDREIICLERTPKDMSLIGGVFRTLHTMKASCGFFEFNRLQKIAHAGEALLAVIRDGERPFTPRVGSVLLRVADRARRCVDHIERTGKEDDEDDQALILSLEAALSASSIVEPVATEAATDTPSSLVPVETSIRVNIDVLDRLMDLVGELVLVRNQLLLRTEGQRDEHLTRSVNQLNDITGRLQDGIMRTRMQPIRTVWSRFPRLVRDTASYCKKEVVLQMSGADTEIDRSVIEAIRDPLTHLIRNAIDHGIETPQERLAAGKSRSGTIHLHAEYENGQVVLTVGDDGRGIDSERLLAKAILKGIVPPNEGATMTPDEIVQFIFLPSFSTADKVTNVSGRGVGMDVVRTNIESIGGSIDTQTEPGRGTKFRLRIPLTLAIVKGLIVRAGNERFVIPQTSLVEVVRLDGEESARAIRRIDGTAILRLRGQLIPLVDLASVLRLDEVVPFDRRDEIHALILQVEAEQFGMIVDEIFDTEEIVIKTLGSMVSSLKVYSGATILGDGTLALVIDVAGLASVSGVRSSRGEIKLTARPEVTDEPSEEVTSFVVVEEAGRRFAVDLSEVRRLEPVFLEAVRPTRHGAAIESRGSVLPVYRLGEMLEMVPPTGQVEASILVVEDDGSRFGILVERVLDIVEDARVAIRFRDGEPVEYLPNGFWRQSGIGNRKSGIGTTICAS